MQMLHMVKFLLLLVKQQRKNLTKYSPITDNQ
jgi:hypothetical protein